MTKSFNFKLKCNYRETGKCPRAPHPSFSPCEEIQQEYTLYDQKLAGMKKKRPEAIKIVLQNWNRDILQFPGHLGAGEPIATVQGIPK